MVYSRTPGKSSEIPGQVSYTDNSMARMTIVLVLSAIAMRRDAAQERKLICDNIGEQFAHRTAHQGPDCCVSEIGRVSMPMIQLMQKWFESRIDLPLD
jgi:hypothetical protein